MRSSGRTPVSEARRLLEEEPDYVHSRRFSNSLAKLVDRYPDGAPAHVVALAFLLTEEALVARYQQIICKLRNAMGVLE